MVNLDIYRPGRRRYKQVIATTRRIPLSGLHAANSWSRERSTHKQLTALWSGVDCLVSEVVWTVLFPPNPTHPRQTFGLATGNYSETGAISWPCIETAYIKAPPSCQLNVSGVHGKGRSVWCRGVAGGEESRKRTRSSRQASLVLSSKCSLEYDPCDGCFYAWPCNTSGTWLP